MAELARAIKQRRVEFHAKITDEIAAESRLAIKAALETELHESRIQSDAFNAALEQIIQNQAISADARLAIDAIQTLLDEKAFRQVVDDTAINRPAEGNAWLRSWEQVLEHKSSEIDSTPVATIELTGQAPNFRGAFVQFSGRVRGGERISVAENELGVKSYNVLWVQPDDSSTTPICVYAVRPPDSFPQLNQQFRELDERAAFEGVFFKLRSYFSNGNKVESCPLVLVESFVWYPQPAATSVAVAWNPPVWLWIVMVVGMLTIAILVAVAVHRSTGLRGFRPRPAASERIQANLAELVHDPSIRSNLERVCSLEEGDRER
jgi:hypothetical protein